MTTCVENLEMSGNLTAAREVSEENLIGGKLLIYGRPME